MKYFVKRNVLISSFRAMIWVSLLLLLNACMLTREQIRQEAQQKSLSDQFRDVQRSSADHQQRFNDVEGELRQLTGRIEVIENYNSKMKMKEVADESGVLDGQQSSDGAEMSKGEAKENAGIGQKSPKMAILIETIAKLEERVIHLESEIEIIKDSKSKNDTKTGLNNKNGDSKATSKSNFDSAEESFEQKDWKNAILSYQKFREKNLQSSKYPVATYKIGVCFQELGMKDDARVFFDEVINKFPKTPEAKKAQFRLKSISKK